MMRLTELIAIVMRVQISLLLKHHYPWMNWKKFVNALSIQNIVNMLTFGKTPILSASELEEMGFKIIVTPIDSVLLTARAMREMAEVFKRDGHTQSLTDKMVDFDEIKKILGLQEFLSLKEDLANKT